MTKQLLTDAEYDIREAFADKSITGWKGRVNVGGCNIPYTHGNAHCMAYHMSKEEFEAAVADPKAFMRKLNPPLITWKLVGKLSLMLAEYGAAIILSVLVGLGVQYITGLQAAGIIATFVCTLASTMSINMRRFL